MSSLASSGGLALFEDFLELSGLDDVVSYNLLDCLVFRPILLDENERKAPNYRRGLLFMSVAFALLLLALIFTLGFPNVAAPGANRYLILGGSCNTLHIATDVNCWAATSGGAGGQSVPDPTDQAFADANSGSGTGTQDALMDVAVLNMAGFTGTWVTAGFALRSESAITIRGTFNASSSIIIATGNFDMFGATFNRGTSTVILTATGTLVCCGNQFQAYFFNLTIGTGATISTSNFTGSDGLVTINGTFDGGGIGRYFLMGGNPAWKFGPSGVWQNFGTTGFVEIRTGGIQANPAVFTNTAFQQRTNSVTYTGSVKTRDFSIYDGTVATFSGGVNVTGGLFVGGVSTPNGIVLTGPYSFYNVSVVAAADYMDLSSSTGYIYGNFSSASTSASWNAGLGTLNFNGTNVQFINATGTKTLFNDVVVSGAEKRFAANFTTNSMQLSGTALTVRVTAAYYTWTVQDLGFISGLAGQILTLRGADASTNWSMMALGANFNVRASYVDVQQSNASSGATVDASDGTDTDSGNNINWAFPPTVVYRYAVGTPCNWSSTSCWSLSSGGASGASAPTANVKAVLDANSGSSAVTVDVASAALALYTAGFTGNLAIGGGTSLTVGAGSGTILHRGGTISVVGQLFGSMVATAAVSMASPGVANFSKLVIKGTGVYAVGSGVVNANGTTSIANGGSMLLATGPVNFNGDVQITATSYMQLGSATITVNANWTDASTSASWSVGTSLTKFVSAFNSTFSFANPGLAANEFYDVVFNSSASTDVHYNQTNDLFVKHNFVLADPVANTIYDHIVNTAFKMNITGDVTIGVGGFLEISSGASPKIVAGGNWDESLGRMFPGLSTVTLNSPSGTLATQAGHPQDEFWNVIIGTGAVITYSTPIWIVNYISVNGSLQVIGGRPWMVGNGVTVIGQQTTDPLIVGPQGDLSSSGQFRYLFLPGGPGLGVNVTGTTYHYLNVMVDTSGNIPQTFTINQTGPIFTKPRSATIPNPGIFNESAMIVHGYLPGQRFTYDTHSFPITLGGTFWTGDVDDGAVNMHLNRSVVDVYGFQTLSNSSVYLENAVLVTRRGQPCCISSAAFDMAFRSTVFGGNAQVTVYDDFFMRGTGTQNSVLNAQNSTWTVLGNATTPSVDSWEVQWNNTILWGTSTWHIQAAWYVDDSRSPLWDPGTATVFFETPRTNYDVSYRRSFSFAGTNLLVPEFYNVVISSASTANNVRLTMTNVNDGGLPRNGDLIVANQLKVLDGVGTTIFDPQGNNVSVAGEFRVENGGIIAVGSNQISAGTTTLVGGNVALTFLAGYRSINIGDGYIHLNGTTVGLRLVLSSGAATGTLRKLGLSNESIAANFTVTATSGNLSIMLEGIGTLAYLLFADNVQKDRAASPILGTITLTYTGPWSAHSFQVNTTGLTLTEAIIVWPYVLFFIFVAFITLMLIGAYTIKRRRAGL